VTLDGYGSEMAKILPFARGRGTRRLSQRGATGEIVIFPGIRVEYHDSPPQPAQKRRQPRGRRGSAKDDALSA
jgi:hypothetical protein